MNITITGPRQIDGIEMKTFGSLFKKFLAPFDRPDTLWFVGGAAGLDTVSLHWLWLEGTGDVVVVVPGKLNQQPADAVAMVHEVTSYAPWRIQVTELEHPDFPQPAAYHNRNHFMVDRSDLVIGFPHRIRSSRGTRATLQYAKDMNVARLEYEIE